MGGADGYGEVFVFTARRSSFSGATTIAVTPRLADNESVVAVFPRAMFRIKGAGAGVLSSGVGGYPGKDNDKTVLFVPKLKEGTLFVTTQRIVFLRRKIDWKDGYLTFKEAWWLGNPPNGVRKDGYVKFANAWWAGDAPDGSLLRVLACGGLEYCEISPGDISRLDRGILGGKLRIDAQGRAYVLRLTRKQTEAVGHLIRKKGSQRPS